mmetsp:Transcript_12654/g.12742  ORF Transcript_12654/g.12742 Transcript_12654/m.12742 type:complete len:257 (+) Transcript_12654:108-878(+)
MRELQRRLKEERHYEDLKKIQAEIGLIPKSHLQRLDWMYEGGSIKNTSSEEYLLGKKFEEPDPEAEKPEWRPILCKESTANSNNEAFTKVHEDPMFAILQEEKRRREDILSNPLKMMQIKKEIEDMKKGKKEKHKKHKKHHHKDYKHNSDRSESTESSRTHKKYGLQGKEVDIEKNLCPDWEIKEKRKEHSRHRDEIIAMSEEERERKIEEMKNCGEMLKKTKEREYEKLDEGKRNHRPKFIEKTGKDAVETLKRR